VFVMLGVRLGVSEGTVAVGVGVSVGGGSVFVGVLEDPGWKGVRVLAHVGVLVAGPEERGLLEGIAVVTAERAAGTRGKWVPKKTRQASRITPIRPRRSITLKKPRHVDDPLAIFFYGFDTTMSM
jgi:hypothetical protein